MSAPYYVRAADGATDAAGAWEYTFSFNPAAGDLIILQVLQDGGTARQIGITGAAGCYALDDAYYLGTLTHVGSYHAASLIQHIYAGWATGAYAPVLNGTNQGSEDVYVRGYTFRGVDPDATTLWDIFGGDPACHGFVRCMEDKGGDSLGGAGYANGRLFATKSSSYDLLVTTQGDPRNTGDVANPRFTTVSNPFGSAALTDIAYAGGVYVASTNTTGIWTATDPTGTWTQRKSLATTCSSVDYDGTYWVVANGTNIWYATDPTGTWTSVATGLSPTNHARYGGGYWVAVGGSPYIRYATNPTSAGNWSTPSSPGFSSAVAGLDYGNGYWAAGSGTDFRYATDPTGTWTNVSGVYTYGSSLAFNAERDQWLTCWAARTGAYANGTPVTWYTHGGSLASVTTRMFEAGPDTYGLDWDGNVLVNSPLRDGSGTGTDITDAGVTTSGPEELALQLVAVNDDNAVGSFTGETGGNWVEAVAEYASSSGTDGCIQLQIARPSAVPSLPHATVSDGIKGSGGADEEQAQSFTTTGAITVTGVVVNVYKSNSPTDSLIAEIQTDSSGKPSGTVVGSSGSIAAADMVADPQEAWERIDCTASLSASTKYWVVLRRSGSRDITNLYGWDYDGYPDGISGEGRASKDSGTWAYTDDWDFGMAVLTATEDAGSTIDGGSYTMAAADPWLVLGGALKGPPPPPSEKLIPIRKLLQAINRANTY